MNANWIPITIVTCLSIIALVRLWLDYRLKTDIQITLRKALDHGEHLSVELLDRIGVERHPHAVDLRRSVLLMALGLATIIGSALTGKIIIGLAVGALPIMLAIAFAILSYLGFLASKNNAS